jgi:hypothetical protein
MELPGASMRVHEVVTIFLHHTNPRKAIIFIATTDKTMLLYLRGIVSISVYYLSYLYHRPGWHL